MSRVFLDREATAQQTRALASVMRAVLGEGRKPMIIVDSESTVASRNTFSARGAGIRGMSTFGRDHFYALDEEMRLRRKELEEWLAQHAGKPPLLFGFTFMVWEHFANQLEDGALDLEGAVLVHSGGWKKLHEQAVGDEEFKGALRDRAGIERVANFYGMVEQIGAVYLECSEGRLHSPHFADALIRDPESWEVLPVGEEGVVQVVSALPRSYPGHSLLTEDLGAIGLRDGCPCGWHGSTLELRGRIPKAELRGCSDTHAADLMAA